MSAYFQRKLIFLDHPRTGGTSVQTAMVKAGARPRKRHTLVTGRAGVMCCTVRNPYDLLASWYQIVGVRESWDFEDFCESYENYNFTRGGRLFYFAQFCNFIMRYERLAKDVNIAMQQAGLRGLELPQLNQTKGKKPYQEYYNTTTVEIVTTRFEQDIKEFGYTYG